MLGTLAVAAVLTLGGSGDHTLPEPGEVYELCSMTLSDGSTVGTTNERCADASPKNGIRIGSTTLQSCRLPHGDLCFTYHHRWGSLFYTIHDGRDNQDNQKR